MDKIDAVKAKESDFVDHCKIIFIKRNLAYTLVGPKKQDNTIVLCFPHDPEKDVMKKFFKLFENNYKIEVVGEKDFTKLQILEEFRNMQVVNFDPYMIKKDPNLSKLPKLFISMDLFGFSFNNVDVSSI